MNNLSKRQIDFILLLLEEKIYQPISYYAKKLEVSTKTLQSDLKKIRSFLECFDAKIDAGSGKGICILVEQEKRNALFNALKADEGSSPESIMSRRLEILKNMLLYTEENVSIQKLSEQYFVGRTSIVNDMKFISKWLEKYNLTLEKTNKGTYIRGTETNIRKAIAGYSMRENTRIELSELFGKEDIFFVEQVLTDVMTEYWNIGDVYYVNMLTHILICIKRVCNSNHLQSEEEVFSIKTNTLDAYHKAEKIAEKINAHYNIQIGEAEKYYIYQYLISAGMNRNTVNDQSRELSDDETIEIAKKMTYRISEHFGVDFNKEEELMKGLVLHIRPMLNRLAYDIQIVNPLKEEIARQYPEMVSYCKEALQEISKEQGLDAKYDFSKISEDEITNLATYYETMLEKITMRKKVLVVCHSGYGTSQLLAAKLRNEFAFLEITDVVSSRAVEKMDLKEEDFIISTIPIERKDIPHIVVSTLLTDSDIKAIREIMLKGWK